MKANAYHNNNIFLRHWADFLHSVQIIAVFVIIDERSTTLMSNLFLLAATVALFLRQTLCYIFCMNTPTRKHKTVLA